MKLFTLSTTVLLNALALLTPLTEAAPVNRMEARALPTPVSAAIAKEYLASLTIKPQANRETYDPDLFPYWIEISRECDTSDVVLQRDGTNVVTDYSDEDCFVESGSWYSTFDGATETYPNHVQIASIVPHFEAWVSGASEWTTDQRQAFANDLTRPQLIAVTGDVNKARGLSDPAEWMPPLVSYHCTYVRAWITVKHHYSLAVDKAEHKALLKYLNTCPEDDA